VYTEQLLRKHPKRERLEFLFVNYSKYARYIRETESVNERKRQQKVWQDWMHLMSQEPLYRNQSELSNLILATHSASTLCSNIYKDADEAEIEKNSLLYWQFHTWPAIKKFYGVTIRNLDDFERWSKQVQIEERQDRESRQQDWTLATPDKEEEFWQWFNDPKTGKPVHIRQESRPSTTKATERSAPPRTHR
jgi:hypothetical protein